VLLPDSPGRGLLAVSRTAYQQAVEKGFVTPARPPWIAEVLETQEQFPVKAGVQKLILMLSRHPGFRRSPE
jgi:hypothetical protein